MRPALRHLAPARLALGGLMGCAGDGTVARDATARTAPAGIAYLGVETRLLEGDLVRFLVSVGETETGAPAIAYAECAAAQYALIRGYGFTRHVRTNVYEEGGIWQGDAVYTVSPSLPDGIRTIDAEVTVASCREQGIPTV
jgi:hypothetical protein